MRVCIPEDAKMALADLYNQLDAPVQKTGRLRNLEGTLELLGEEAESLVDILSNIVVSLKNLIAI